MIKGLFLALFLLPSTASALDIKFGLMQTLDPLYENKYDGIVTADGHTIDDDGIVGRIDLTQRFKFSKGASFNIFFTHMSLFGESDPHHGINAVGAEMEFKFKFGE